jgi:hypothetical protein
LAKGIQSLGAGSRPYEQGCWQTQTTRGFYCAKGENEMSVFSGSERGEQRAVKRRGRGEAD